MNINWLWLTLKKGLSPAKIGMLCEMLGDADGIYSAGRDELSGFGLTESSVRDLCDKSYDNCYRVMEDCERIGARILTIEDSLYPDSLRVIAQPPYVLYTRGEEIDFENELSIGIVGTRTSTDYGAVVTDRLSFELASAGVLIVSGMALGIDGCAARGAIRAGGKTVAVLGCGVDVPYPARHKKLMDEICTHGAVFSEYPPGTPPASFRFPERNRIISGLSQGILVTEAPIKSGALITANSALDSGRDLFSVPGSILSPNSAGCNLLIQQGAIPVCTAEDLLVHYPFFERKAKTPPKKPKTLLVADSDDRFSTYPEDQRSILSLLARKDMNIDEISATTEIPVSVLNTKLTLMEISGAVERLAGNMYKLKL